MPERLTTHEAACARIIAVERVLPVLRRGGWVRLRDAAGSALVAAVDALDHDELDRAGAPGGATSLVLTTRRAVVLGFKAPTGPVVRFDFAERAGVERVRSLAGLAAQPRGAMPAGALHPGERRELAAVELCKLAGLMPAALELAEGSRQSETVVAVADVLDYRRLASLALRPVSEARVPLADAEDARVVAFRSTDGRPEQLAIVIGDPHAVRAPLCRLHSECFTGDLLGSLRCDCGAQLRGAIRRMAEEGAGVLLYLAQEGRGIGLVNKLRAYGLQDAGLDTLEANEHLGFEVDERDWLSAATMLQQLGLSRVRLLTNNPRKVDALRAHGINVVERVPHAFSPTHHNRDYLRAKAERGGHLFTIEEIEPVPGLVIEREDKP